MQTIKLGIVGYGNLGKGVKSAVEQNPDLELVAIFSRRPASSLKIEGDRPEVVNVDQAEDYRDRINVMLLCGGSATDLPVQGPQFSAMFNTVDSYDTHARIPEYFKKMDRIASENGNLAAISIGWDPGLFSLNRTIFEAVLPEGKGYTFWGHGVSQGHSDAIRRIEGVADAVQYTVPLDQAIERVRQGENPDLATGDRHIRECYVVAEEGADKQQIEREIKTMPNYFADYETRVSFVTASELKQNHSKLPHGGFVLHSGSTGNKGQNQQVMEFSLDLDSNPEFTASVLLAYARAVYRLRQQGQTGAVTIFDIPPAYLSQKSPDVLRREML